MSLIDSLKIVLAENFALYLKAHYYHWNVEGSDFYQLHEFFGDLYEEVYSSIDKFAEEIRALNSYAPGSFKRYSELSKIEGEERILTSKEMISQLLTDNNTYINTLTEAFQLSENQKEIGLSNFIQDRIDQHKKHAWMLRSFLKGL
jgi:starvation-inducible DNA-binding protein